MNLLVVVRKYFSILAVVMLNLIFFFILIFSNILIEVEQTEKLRIKMTWEQVFQSTLLYFA